LIAACGGSSPQRRRDRAILLLPARLGLRAGDVALLRLGDIEWQTGTLRVSGKGRYQVRLPLPQEVGDWIKTLPGQGWFTYFRWYGPTQAFFDRKWTLPDTERFAQ
jgi:integrase